MRGIRSGVLIIALALLCCACKGTPSGGSASEGFLVSVGGIELGMGELTYLMDDMVDQYLMYQDVDWEGTIDGVPAEQYFLGQTLETAVTAHVINLKAAELGYALTDEEESAIDWDIALEVDYQGSREAFLSTLDKAGLTEELYRFYIYTVPALQDKMLSGLFGDGGMFAPDDTAMRAYYQKNYVPACYLFLSGTDEMGLPLTGDLWDTQKSVAEALRKKAVSGETEFFTLVEEYGQDYLMSLYPEGMPIKLGDLGSAFDAALLSLGVAEVSEVVSTADGFYIILRLPEDWDWYEQNTEDVWYFCASDLFAQTINEWSQSIEIIVSDAYHTLDPREMIAEG